MQKKQMSSKAATLTCAEENIYISWIETRLKRAQWRITGGIEHISGIIESITLYSSLHKLTHISELEPGAKNTWKLYNMQKVLKPALMLLKQRRKQSLAACIKRKSSLIYTYIPAIPISFTFVCLGEFMITYTMAQTMLIWYIIWKAACCCHLHHAACSSEKT